MKTLRLLPILAGLSALLALEASAFAGDRDDDPSSGQALPAPTPPGTPGSTTVVAPQGSGGVTVVAPTAGGGQVTASGCSTVVVQGNPTLVGPGGAPCPTLQPYQPYQPYGAYPPPPMYEARPRYARDPDRTAAVVASAVAFGVGGGISGLMYLVQLSEQHDHCGRTRTDYSSGTGSVQYVDNSGCGAARASLITYGAIMTFIPSLPRFVVGDSTRGLIYTGLRGASFSIAALVDWGNNTDTKWQGPFLLGFVAPLTLGIIDIATTPHREDLEAKTAKAGISGVAPVALGDGRGNIAGGGLSMQGLF